MAKKLAELQGIEVLFSQQPNSPNVTLGKRCTWINNEHKKNPILCLVSFHADNGSAKSSGWSVFHWHTSTKGKRLAELWAEYAGQLLPIPSKGIRKCVPGTWSNFDIVRKPVVPCILIEHFYFSNLDELAKCNTHEFIFKAAEVTVKAICEYAGINYDSIKAYKTIMQSRIRLDDPDGLWVLLDQHKYPESMYRKLVLGYERGKDED
jgi:N-acetylmuramoyl-L-alanine amidase